MIYSACNFEGGRGGGARACCFLLVFLNFYLSLLPRMLFKHLCIHRGWYLCLLHIILGCEALPECAGVADLRYIAVK